MLIIKIMTLMLGEDDESILLSAIAEEKLELLELDVIDEALVKAAEHWEVCAFIGIT